MMGDIESSMVSNCNYLFHYLRIIFESTISDEVVMLGLMSYGYTADLRILCRRD
jgi:hypothetical protein